MKMQYFIKKRQNPNSKIFLRLWESKKFDFTTSTGFQVKYTHWNFNDEKIKNKDKNKINLKQESCVFLHTIFRGLQYLVY